MKKLASLVLVGVIGFTTNVMAQNKDAASSVGSKEMSTCAAGQGPANTVSRGQSEATGQTKQETSVNTQGSKAESIK